jgi:AcrR family transcriptional regulator
MRLPRAAVRESQRERLMIAMVELVDRQGFPGTSIAGLTDRAHVSRSAFYEHFGSTEACFAATYDTHVARCTGQAVSAYNTPGLRHEQRVKAGLEALFAFAQAWPAAARVCLGDVLTVAHGMIERRAEAEAAARQMLLTALRRDDRKSKLAPSLTTATAGAVRRTTYTHLREHRRREPDQLGDELLAWILTYRDRHTDMIGAARSRATGRRKRPATRRDSGAPDDGSKAARDPRERIMRAILTLSAGKDGLNVSHRDIATTARVSYGTFYKHFQSKQEAQLAACDVVRKRLADRIKTAVAAAPDWPTGMRDGLAAYLDVAAADPDATRVMALEALSLGRPGLDFLDKRAKDLEEVLRPGLEMSPDLPSAITDAVTGGILEIVHEHALKRRIERLPRLHGELTYITLTPFIGARDAALLASEG